MNDYDIGLAKLRELARSWGGGIVEVLREDPLWDSDKVDGAPFSHKLGVDYEHKTIYVIDGAELGGLIHEMGHVFACASSPYKSDEYEFFGWEFMVAVKLDLVLEWLEQTKDYAAGGEGMANIEDFGDMTIDEQSDLIEERVQHARLIGIVVGEEPIAIR